MKRINYFIITLFLITGYAGSIKSADELVVINVTKSYPKKELNLKDIVDIEYIPLETTNEFLCPGNLKATVSDNLIAVTDPKGSAIILFDRTGKGLKNINKRGQGPGEYLMVSEIALDEDNNEMYVLDMILTQIFVYDLQGKFIRSFKFQDGYNAQSIRNFDREHLMCLGIYKPQDVKPPFFVISKKDGAFKEFIEIPRIKQISISSNQLGFRSTVFPLSYVPYRNNWMLSDYSSDSIFMFSLDFKLTPFIARTPPIHSMNPEVVLRPTMFTDRYYFMEIEKYTSGEDVRTQLVYDCMEKALFEFTIYNDDYPDKPFVIPRGTAITSNEVVSVSKFESFELVEAYKEGKLKGRLKEIASKSDDEDNPVLMLLKHKK